MYWSSTNIVDKRKECVRTRGQVTGVHRRIDFAKKEMQMLVKEYKIKKINLFAKAKQQSWIDLVNELYDTWGMCTKLFERN